MRIIIADGWPKVRLALRVLLQRQPGFEVVGTARNEEDLLVQVEETLPDVVLLHWRLPGRAAARLLPDLREICPDIYVIALSAHLESRDASLAAGADAFVSKMDPPEQLLKVILESNGRRPRDD